MNNKGRDLAIMMQLEELRENKDGFNELMVKKQEILNILDSKAARLVLLEALKLFAENELNKNIKLHDYVSKIMEEENNNFDPDKRL